MLIKHKVQAQRPAKWLTVMFGMAALLSYPTLADTVYRCGEAYSTSNQCDNSVATEIKPSTIRHTTGPDQANTATRDLLDAQTLEKQRLHAEQQAAQAAAPIRLRPPRAPLAIPSNHTHHEPIANSGKHPRKTNSPYFTAVDPTAAAKKKGSAKAVPANVSP
jgi:hypothetical protein